MYAAALDQSGARTFWAVTALHNYIAFGADATNTFAEAIATKLFSLIQKHLKQPLKFLGVLPMFNGLDISQSDKFILVSCSTYITKILEGHNWKRPT